MLSGLLQSYVDFIKSIEDKFTTPPPALNVPDRVNIVWITHPGMKAKWEKNFYLCFRIESPSKQSYEIKMFWDRTHLVKKVGEDKYGLMNLALVSWDGWNEYVLHDKTASLDHLINTAYYKVNV